MVLHFIKGESPENWQAMRLTLKKNASPAIVISKMENDGWTAVTLAAYKEWCKSMNGNRPERG